jgi:hypothetical protein
VRVSEEPVKKARMEPSRKPTTRQSVRCGTNAMQVGDEADRATWEISLRARSTIKTVPLRSAHPRRYEVGWKQHAVTGEALLKELRA